MEFTVNIKTLTPLWTGDAEKKCSTLRETGIIGSLRWWYEALVRGLGGTACDPTNSECEGKHHCDACELFGCTGWARKFKLEVEIDDEAKNIREIKIGTREKKKVKDKDKFEYKYLLREAKGMMLKNASLKFLTLREISEDEWNLLNNTLYIISNYGALGASTSQGNGVINITSSKPPIAIGQLSKKAQELSQLGDFFFYKLKLEFNESILELIKKKVFWTHSEKHSGYKENWQRWIDAWDKHNFLPIAFHIRDSIRHIENNRGKRHEIFGEAGRGSTVFVSHGYRISENTVEVRIYGYNKENIGNKIKDKLNDNIKDKLFSLSKYNSCLNKCFFDM